MNTDAEDKRAHLGMVQDIINRMSVNSFLLKGWTVGLVSALITAASLQDKREIVLLAYLPAGAFWLLDAYYLHQERLFRTLYNRVRGTDPGDIDYSMDITPVRDQTSGFWRAVFSTTLVAFHVVVILAIVVVMILI